MLLLAAAHVAAGRLASFGECMADEKPAEAARARKTVAVTVGPGAIQVAVETSITVTAARAASRDIRRHKASDYG